jgi:multimeric flavodoxin WrbA
MDKMVAADVIVMATPVYLYHGQMKTLIDRTYQDIWKSKIKTFISLQLRSHKKTGS